MTGQPDSGTLAGAGKDRPHARIDQSALPATATSREIAQQPAVWREVAATLAGRSGDVRGFLDPLLALPDLRIVLSGAGTSAFVGEVLAPALTRSLGRRVEAVATTDLVASPREGFAEDLPTLLVSFARSGDSPESVAATQLADQCLTSVHHLVVTCNPDGRLAADHARSASSFVLLMPPSTNDRGFAMTSSFTSMLLASRLVLSPTSGDGVLVERLASAAEGLLTELTSVSDLARRGYQRVVYLGSGPLAGLARESALKLLELTAGRVVSYYDTALGFRHGPKAVLDERTLVVVYLSNDAYTRRYDQDIAAELRLAVGEENVLVLGGGPADATDAAWHLDGVDAVDDAALALPLALVAQTLALRFSLELGLDPDNPFPTGEVNRVVEGVTVHPLPS